MKQIKTLLLSLLAATSLSAQEQKLAGGDISMLPKYESQGAWFFDENGTRINDVFSFMTGEKVGWNAMRVRLFVNPEKAPMADRDAVVQDLAYVTELGKRIKQRGLKFLLDFHYSDSWADPAKQTKPSDWSALSAPAMANKLYEYTKASLEHLKANNAAPDYIQTGNEISYGMLWDEGKVSTTSASNWDNFTNYLKKAGKACREVCPDAKIIIHIERAKQPTVTRDYYKKLAAYGVDYDIIGLSYYPFWHGSLTTLGTTLSTLQTEFPEKKVQIVETAYYYQWYPTSGVDDFTSVWPASEAGQDAFLKDLIAELHKHSNVNALYYWFPEENGHGNSVVSSWQNRGLWNNNNGRVMKGLYRLKEYLAQSPTSIPSIQQNTAATANGRWYALNGQSSRQATAKGIYIHRGKKLIVK
ncbi:glycosyl hydrolase 53 family protein [Prevotella sp. HUN102]|uniref:glycosyl hydrolase 53 family protein n=1 Tax=Prevotella sp. HUN102 TaxID=1392486 RepID=UPI000490D945|nr:glycosyl hydrolase 53 family protein [Prevotella sp. HUN102]